MDGSNPSFRNVCSSMCKSFNFYLDFFWSRAAIYLQPFASTLWNAQHFTQTNNILSPWVVTAQSKDFPPPQGRASRMRRCGNMVRGATLCTPRTQSPVEGRHWSFPGWGSFRYPNCLAKWIFAKLWTFSWQYCQIFFQNLVCLCSFFA